MTKYTTTQAEGGEGWGIQRVGPWVLGLWQAPMTYERILACRRLYRDALEAHGKLSVFTIHRTNPFPLETLSSTRSREMTISLLREFDRSFQVFICGIEGNGFMASTIRIGAAAVVSQMRSHMPIVFVSSVQAGLEIARTRGPCDVVPLATLEREFAMLERQVVEGTFARP